MKGIIGSILAATVVFHFVTGMPWMFCLIVVPVSAVALNLILDVIL